MKRGAGVALVLLSAVCFGFIALFNHWARSAPDGPVGTEMLLFLRFAAAALILSAAAIATGVRLPRGRLLAAAVALGAVGYVGESICYFKALDYIPAGLNAALLYAYPAIVTLLSAGLLRERIGRTRLLAVAVAVTGTVLASPLAGIADHAAGPGRAGPPWIGVLLALGSAVSYAGYIVAGSRITPRIGALASSLVVCASAAAVYGVLALGRGQHLPASGQAWGAVAALAVVATVIPIAAIFAGFRWLGPVQVSTLSTVEPITAALVGFFSLGERLTLVQGAGGVLILIAAVVIARGGDRGPGPAPPAQRRPPA